MPVADHRDAFRPVEQRQEVGQGALGCLIDDHQVEHSGFEGNALGGLAGDDPDREDVEHPFEVPGGLWLHLQVPSIGRGESPRCFEPVSVGGDPLKPCPLSVGKRLRLELRVDAGDAGLEGTGVELFKEGIDLGNRPRVAGREDFVVPRPNGRPVVARDDGRCPTEFGVGPFELVGRALFEGRAGRGGELIPLCDPAGDAVGVGHSGVSYIGKVVGGLKVEERGRPSLPPGADPLVRCGDLVEFSVEFLDLDMCPVCTAPCLDELVDRPGAEDFSCN